MLHITIITISLIFMKLSKFEVVRGSKALRCTEVGVKRISIGGDGVLWSQICPGSSVSSRVSSLLFIK